MQNAAFKLQVSVRQLGTQNAMTMCRSILKLFFLPVQLNPLNAVLHIQNIAEKENINVRCCLPQNWNQAVHTERIFIAFSRRTSIILHSRLTREPKDMSNSCKFNF